jgi:hypothetical protein
VWRERLCGKTAESETLKGHALSAVSHVSGCLTEDTEGLLLFFISSLILLILFSWKICTPIKIRVEKNRQIPQLNLNSEGHILFINGYHPTNTHTHTHQRRMGVIS